MFKRILLFIGLFVLLPVNVKAALCENKDMIASFVMSFGKNCKVIEPQWLKDKVKRHYLDAIKLYEE